MSFKVKRNPRSQGQTKFQPSAPNFAAICTLYTCSLTIVNLIIGFYKTQYIKKKSSPGIGEGRIIKGSAMATFYRDGQLSTAYGNDQCHHAILNRPFWVMRFSSKWLVFKVPFCIYCSY